MLRAAVEVGAAEHAATVGVGLGAVPEAHQQVLQQRQAVWLIGGLLQQGAHQVALHRAAEARQPRRLGDGVGQLRGAQPRGQEQAGVDRLGQVREVGAGAEELRAQGDDTMAVGMGDGPSSRATKAAASAESRAW